MTVSGTSSTTRRNLFVSTAKQLAEGFTIRQEALACGETASAASRRFSCSEFLRKPVGRWPLAYYYLYQGIASQATTAGKDS